jgi:hypothetical protein
VRSGDLAGGDLVVVADVRRRISPPMLELDFETQPELLDVKARAAPVDSDPLADFPRFVC